MNEKVFTVQELALRNGVTSPEIWVGYKGLIYDVTESVLFEGGMHYDHACGVDLTKEMMDAPHMDDVMSRFPVVGRLAGSME